MKKYFFTSFLFLLFLFLFAVSVNAQSTMTPSPTPACTQGTTGCPLTLSNPLSVDTPQALIGKIINAVLGVVGSLALLMFVYGGLTWMTSSGSQEKVKKGRDIIVWSAIGLAIIFASYGLVRILLTAVK